MATQRTWATLTIAKVANDSNPAMFAAPGRYNIANALMLKAAWLCCVLGGIYYGVPALAAMFARMHLEAAAKTAGGG